MLSQLVDAVGHLLKLYGPQFMPVFDQLVVPAFAPYLAAEQPEALQVSDYRVQSTKYKSTEYKNIEYRVLQSIECKSTEYKSTKYKSTEYKSIESPL